MAKIMVFIDGTWLYSNHRNLQEAYGDEFQIDYGKLPSTIGKIVSENLGGADVDIVRTHLYGSNARNYSDDDRDMVFRRKDFFNLLREEYHYEVDVYEIDYRGRRLRRKDRELGDDFVPEEKCVDIALASSMMFYAALPYAYDIAVLVGGDRDYIPALQRVRQLGKRVVIASIKNSCPREFRDTSNPLGVRDFDMVWMDDKKVMEEYKLEAIKKWVICRSPLHTTENPVWTDEFVRKSRPYYCRECRENMRRQREEYFQSEDNGALSEGGFIPPNAPVKPVRPSIARPITSSPSSADIQEEDKMHEDDDGLRTGDLYDGIVKKVTDSFGFIGTEAGDFYFTVQDMAAGSEFHYIQPGTRVEFIVGRLPNPQFRGGRGNGNAEEVTVTY
jgi:uncharacterized LabA/DUF88 family protein